LYFEYLPKVILIPDPFTQANSMVTATFKVRRPEIAKRYSERIEKVYKEAKVKFIH